MNVSVSHILSLFSLLLWNNVFPNVDAFCSVASCSSTISDKPTTTIFDGSIPTRLGSLSDDSIESENEKEDIFKNMAMNDIRKARLEKELSNAKRFATGEELASLREDLESLRQNLEWARALNDESRIKSLENAIRKGENRDPTFMYNKAQKIIAETKRIEDATEEEKQIVIDKWSQLASDAREFLPQLNMEGLWVGK